ncbi:MAG: hypothetical protein QXS74_07945, partial [Nitrososphaeria archaeon]
CCRILCWSGDCSKSWKTYVVWFEPILLAIMLMVTLIFRPEGILPEKSPRIKDYMKKVLNLES